MKPSSEVRPERKTGPTDSATPEVPESIRELPDLERVGLPIVPGDPERSAIGANDFGFDEVTAIDPAAVRQDVPQNPDQDGYPLVPDGATPETESGMTAVMPEVAPETSLPGDGPFGSSDFDEDSFLKNLTEEDIRPVEETSPFEVDEETGKVTVRGSDIEEEAEDPAAAEAAPQEETLREINFDGIAEEFEGLVPRRAASRGPAVPRPEADSVVESEIPLGGPERSSIPFSFYEYKGVHYFTLEVSNQETIQFALKFKDFKEDKTIDQFKRHMAKTLEAANCLDVDAIAGAMCNDEKLATGGFLITRRTSLESGRETGLHTYVTRERDGDGYRPVNWHFSTDRTLNIDTVLVPNKPNAGLETLLRNATLIVPEHELRANPAGNALARAAVIAGERPICFGDMDADKLRSIDRTTTFVIRGVSLRTPEAFKEQITPTLSDAPEPGKTVRELDSELRALRAGRKPEAPPVQESGFRRFFRKIGERFRGTTPEPAPVDPLIETEASIADQKRASVRAVAANLRNAFADKEIIVIHSGSERRHSAADVLPFLNPKLPEDFQLPGDVVKEGGSPRAAVAVQSIDWDQLRRILKADYEGYASASLNVYRRSSMPATDDDTIVVTTKRTLGSGLTREEAEGTIRFQRVKEDPNRVIMTIHHAGELVKHREIFAQRAPQYLFDFLNERTQAGMTMVSADVVDDIAKRLEQESKMNWAERLFTRNRVTRQERAIMKARIAMGAESLEVPVNEPEGARPVMVKYSDVRKAS